MKVTALIMAGGKGERFWPRSRKNNPKQFLCLTGDGKTMIQQTVERILPLVDIEDVYIATNAQYKQLVKEQLPDLPEENILCEPVGRNTAPCIGLGAVHIKKKYDDAIMLVLPSDHIIKFQGVFLNVLKEAAAIAEKEHNLVTIGITPNMPETGYGYIKFNPDKTDGELYVSSHACAIHTADLEFGQKNNEQNYPPEEPDEMVPVPIPIPKKHESTIICQP